MITKNHLSSISTRDVAEQEFSYDKFPLAVSSKKEMLFDVAPMMERPLILDTISWATTDARFKILKVTKLMNDLFVSSASLQTYLKNYSYFRCHACAYVTVTGTINHQGNILVGALPSTYTYNSSTDGPAMINSLMTAPHAILGANEATSACVEIPFYVATDYLTLDATAGGDPGNPDLVLPGYNNYAELIFLVLNPLAVAGASSTSITVHTQIKINKLEVYTQTPGSPTYVSPPTTFSAESMLGRVVTSTLDKTSELLKTTSADFIDALRSIVRGYTGLHNPNVPEFHAPHYMQTRNRANIVDAPTYYEKLDPYSHFTRLTKDAIFHSQIDEMDINYILSKPQYVGSFKVDSTLTTGTLLWASPISPWQGGLFGGQATTSNIERLYYNSQAWSGDMELIIQSSMTNKQNLKILVAKMYGLDRRIVTSQPNYATIKTGITSLLEFSAGNQQLSVDLDFLSRNQLLYNTVDPAANALQHGMYYIFLAQPLVVADSVPTTVEFNVFLKCKPNFRFYGYSVRPAYSSTRSAAGPYIPVTTLATIAEEGSILSSESLTSNDSAKVMNEPSSSKELTDVNKSGVTPILKVVERMFPISHLRELVRRVQFAGRYRAVADGDGIYTSVIPVSSLAGLFPSAQSDDPPNQNLIKMYAGHNIGLRIKIRSFDSSNFFVQYYPPTLVNGFTGTPSNASATFYSNSVTSNSNFVNLVKGSVNSGPFLEMPSMWTADIKAQETGSVFEVHIPHTTIFNFWGGCEWSSNPSSVNFGNYTSVLNNNGYLIISGIGTPNQPVEFEMFTGLDDESRVGYHVVAPIMWLPLNSAKTQYELPELIPVAGGTPSKIAVNQPKSCYYTNLTTSFNTPL